MRKTLGIALMGIVIIAQLLLILALLWALGWSLVNGAWFTFLFWLIFGVPIITIIGGFITLPLTALASRMVRLEE